jgi:hypothetical protein
MCDFDIPIPWPTFWILLGLVVALLAIWTLQLRKNDYSVIDLFMEGEPRKASVNNHIIIGSFLLSVWLVIMRSLDVADTIPESVDTLLLGVLGIFVLGRAAGHAIHTTGQTITRKAAINQGRRSGVDPDGLTVEEEEAEAERAGPQRRKTDSLLK